ncbi:ly6/PLAUR domain-containing protein 8 [Nothobranchius furzeri]|uniref:LOC107394524-like protein n=1 Tax=Nothobranchius furzeri TaxID=105023 RepID=A0A9D2XZP1_NOTFU|nr:putative LOC107394524-like protein [Nothobranchius furzeri]
MGKVLFAIVAVLASLVLVESLSCNQCSFGLLGTCLSQSSVACTTNTSTCYTGKTIFPSLSSFLGFNNQGCKADSTNCNTTTQGTLMFVTYNTTFTCCSTNNCNPITISSATTAKMTFTGAVSAAILASVLGSIM